jgi:Secretion system C-terminal sorting domain
MIRFVLFIALNVLLGRLNAQDLQTCRQVIGTSGLSTTENGLRWSYTVGETAVFTVRNASNTYIFTQGFQQPDGCTTSSVTDQNLADDWQLQIYPNPATDRVTIQFALPNDHALSCMVFNQFGQLVKGPQLLTEQNGQQLDCSGWAAGMYFVRLEHPITRQTVTARVVKL